MLSDSDNPAPGGAAFPSEEELAAWLPQFQVEKRLFAGRDSAVYVAWQPSLERRVMIRVLPEPSAEDAALLLDKLRNRARLVHPQIVSVFDFGRIASGPLYLVTEHVDGGVLEDLIQDKKITAKLAYQLAGQLCETLQVVHDQHVIHGALSTRTVLVSQEGRLKLTGIGMTEAEEGEVSWLGESAASFDDDIEALGRVIHAMFCGSEPRAVADISKALPAPFARVIEKCLDPEPSRRFESPHDVRTALANALKAEKQAAAARNSPVAPGKPAANPATAAAPPRMQAGLPMRPAAPAPAHYRPGQVPQFEYEPPPRRGLLKRIDDFLWSVLRVSLHLAIFGGTLLIVGGYVLLKDKIVLADPEDEESRAEQISTAQSIKELDGRYMIAVRNLARAAVMERRGEDVTVLQRELRRLQEGGALPAQDEEDLPEGLRKLREGYRRERASLTQ